MKNLSGVEIDSVGGATALGAAAGAWVGGVAGAAVFMIADGSTGGLLTPVGGAAVTLSASVGAGIGNAISNIL